jgi:hypothetical protein
MRIRRSILVLTLFASGCAGVDPRIHNAEQLVRGNARALARLDTSYDTSERDIAQLRLAVDDIVARERNAAKQLEMAAREYEYATVHYHLTSNELARAARNYEIAAAEYEMVATMLIRAASSKGLRRSLCGPDVHNEELGELPRGSRATFTRDATKPIRKTPSLTTSMAASW